MAGPIMYMQLKEGVAEPLAVVPNLSAYEVQTQIQAMEAQAGAMDKMLVITAVLQEWPVADDPEEEDKSDDDK